MDIETISIALDALAKAVALFPGLESIAGRLARSKREVPHAERRETAFAKLIVAESSELDRLAAEYSRILSSKTYDSVEKDRAKGRVRAKIGEILTQLSSASELIPEYVQLKANFTTPEP